MVRRSTGVRLAIVTETNRTQSILYGMQNRTVGPYLETKHGIRHSRNGVRPAMGDGWIKFHEFLKYFLNLGVLRSLTLWCMASNAARRAMVCIVIQRAHRSPASPPVSAPSSTTRASAMSWWVPVHVQCGMLGHSTTTTAGCSIAVWMENGLFTLSRRLLAENSLPGGAGLAGQRGLPSQVYFEWSHRNPILGLPVDLCPTTCLSPLEK
jgi:hypothetical protein